jgi:hypothetical protein
MMDNQIQALSIACSAHAKPLLEKLLGPATVVVKNGGVDPKFYMHYRLKKPTETEDGSRFAHLFELTCNLAAKIDGVISSNGHVAHADPKYCRIVSQNPDVTVDLDVAVRILSKATGNGGEELAAPKTNGGNSRASEPPMLAAALDYAMRGWDVFPADTSLDEKTGKFRKKSFKAAQYSNGASWGKTRDPAQIRRDFARWPEASIGLPTGRDNGFFVVETDTKAGHASLEKDGDASLRVLEEKYGALPPTLMAESPSGSRHRYFSWPKGVVIRNSTSTIAPGIDVRGDGGMVIAPPSVRDDGVYRWLNDNNIADAPQWLIDLACRPASRGSRTSNGAGQFDEQKIAVASEFAHLDPNERLAEGIEGPSPLPFAPIRRGCGWLKHVHDTGGADQGEPLWHDMLRCCRFLADGEKLIHELGNQHDGYAPEETEAKFAHVCKDKESKDLGWPLCKTIKENGCTHCKTCPHFAEGRSSLHLAQQQAPLPADDFKQKDEYDPIDRNAPELVKCDAVWVTRIFEGDMDATYQNDSSQLAFAVACELVRIGLDNTFIARVLMTTTCGAYVQQRPGWRLLRTIRRACEFAIDPDLEAMNNQHAVLPIGGKTRVVTWGDDPDFPGRKTIVRAQTFDDFKNLHSNKRKRIKTNDDGNQPMRLGHWWLGQKHRRQYDGGQRFMPQHEAEVAGSVLNMFEGFPIQPRKPEGRSGAMGCQLFLDHGRKIVCSGDEGHWDYLLKREAWIAQNRRRSEIACAYRTEEEGSGKGFWCNHLGHLYGPYYMQVNKAEHVVGKHNRHLETLLKLCADEALFVGDPRHRNALFGLITEPTVDIEPKFIDVYPAPNHLNIDIISNAKHFVPVSRTARRFFIPTVSCDRIGDFRYFSAIEQQLRDGGYEALLYHLLYEVDLQDFEIRRVPRTAELAEQAGYSRKGVDGLVETVCSEGCVPYPHSEWPGFSVSNGCEDRQGFDYFINTHVDRDLHTLGALKVKNQLRKEWRCTTGKDARRRDGYEFINGVQWPPLQELRDLFVGRHGPQDWLNPDVTEWPVGLTQKWIGSTGGLQS